MQFKLRTKLLAGFVLVSLIGAGIGIFGVIQLSRANDGLHQIYEKNIQALVYTSHLAVDFQQLRLHLTKAVYVDSVQETQSEIKQFQDWLANSEPVIKKYPATFRTQTDQDDFDQFLSTRKKYIDNSVVVFSMLNQGRHADAGVFIRDQTENGMVAQAVAHQTAVDNLVKNNEDSAKSNTDRLDAEVQLAEGIMLPATALGFLVSIFLAIWLGVWVVSRPLMRLSDTLQSGSEQIAAASNQLASSAQMISSGATEQASSVEETSASMEELSSMVKQNLSSSREASILAEKASVSSQEGFADMNKMVEAMKDIARSSGQVGKVIKLIEDISFQTNILALNAAVEAARAGEAGMGFAVVADEVKNLANRSADAAKETAQMIEDSIRKTEEGANLANRLAEGFKEIISNVQKMATMSKEVEISSTQQDTGINQVTQAIIQFDEVVQSNASTAEESASSAEELSSQAASLMKIVSDLTIIVNGQATQTQFVQPPRIHSRQALPPKPLPASKRPGVPNRTIVQNHPELKKRELSPDALIPFEDDEELKNL